MKKVFCLFCYTLMILAFCHFHPEASFANANHHSSTVEVILRRVYLDGEVSEEVKTEHHHSIADVIAKYQDWQVVCQDGDEIVFQKQIDDLSPLLKTNGFFGIMEDGTLSIFNGKPDADNEVIQSFFQIDIKKLESYRHLQLKRGIPVKNKENYLNVINTFKAYSADEFK
ncbi:BofC C-terminal domain-containing protein [Aeribacillus composti]|uniref:BofC C-terminal domain-containing protein n=1 Tax=Aeribacillus composti TaxID=1868734 RepID=UPI002E1AF074|nr:BofC C-terminal domain-containing protein [Aeribacillus composti]